jgi:cytochrome c-type biogenesis protein CcmH/NrfG
LPEAKFEDDGKITL